MLVNPTLPLYGPHLNSVALLATTYQFLPWLLQSTSRGNHDKISLFVSVSLPNQIVQLPQLSQSTSRVPLPGLTPSLDSHCCCLLEKDDFNGGRDRILTPDFSTRMEHKTQWPDFHSLPSQRFRKWRLQ